MPNTVAKVILDDGDLNTLENAVIKANITETLNGPGPLTLFAPTNEGFDNAGITSADIDAMASSDMENLLLYHVIPSEIFAANVPAGPNEKVITANGDSVFVTNNSNGVFINGVQVVQADIDATNGVVHKIDNVLMPAIGNIVETAQADTSFTFLVAAIIHASTGLYDIEGVLSDGDLHTVFAPTNNAFRTFGLESIDKINAVDPDLLGYILLYHVINGRKFSPDLPDGLQSTLNGQPITVTTSGDFTVQGKTNTSASNVLKANMVATNGVIHVIDQLLTP
jgi:uncharacterized surface protein with fasciclin (FAS1) repeats